MEFVHLFVNARIVKIQLILNKEHKLFKK
jgi:hypothetical protein